MRTASRLAFSAAVLGGGLLIAAPASAQEACEYPFDCPPVGGGDGGPATGDGGGGGAPGTDVGGGGGGGGTVVDASPITGGGGGAGQLPFTGGEVTLMALAGTAALSGGIVLVAATRKRSTV